jgi:PHD/YefM family antitoxin component YafN of YafNO toxin-antitoxin module
MSLGGIMETKIMSSDAVRSDWSEVIDNIMAGGTVLVERDDKRVAVVIPYEDFLAVREQLEDLYDLRMAEAAYDAYLRDPSGARPLKELKAEWAAKDAEEDVAKEAAKASE